MDTKICPICNNELPSEAVFCPYCMTKLINGKKTKPLKVKRKLPIMLIAVVLVIAILATAGIIFIKPGVTAKPKETVNVATNGERISFGCFDREFSIIVPDDYWYEIKYGKIFFYERYNYNNKIEDTDYGYIGYITSMTDNEIKEDELGKTILGKSDGINYVFQMPSGFGITDDKTANEKLTRALKETKTIKNSFEFAQDSNNSSKKSKVISSGKRIYFNGGFSLVLPYDWTYEETGNEVFFYDTYNYGSTEGGLLICIVKVKSDKKDEYEYMFQKIKENDGYIYYYTEARDVEYNTDDKNSEERYNQAYEEIQDVLSTFTCTN